MTPSRLGLVLVLAAAAACVPPRPPAWLLTEPSYVAPRSGFEIVPPPQWMRLNAKEEVLVLTHDGTALQRIVVGTSQVGKPIGLGRSKRAAQAGMSPQELAELVVDDLRATEELTDVRVLENAPASLAGRPGFHVVAAYRDGTGLARRTSIYGVVEGGRVYQLAYIAAERHYWARDLPVFEQVVQTFRLRAPVPGP